MFSIMHFHASARATRMCVCHVIGVIGYDACNNKYKTVVDDFGSIVFVA